MADRTVLPHHGSGGSRRVTTEPSRVVARADERLPMGDVANLLGGREVLAMAQADVVAARERTRQKRLAWLAVTIGIPALFLWYRILDGRPFNVFALPNVGGDPLLLI